MQQRPVDTNLPAFVTTNDYITATVCELLDPSSICAINADMRGRLPHLGQNQIGNLQRAILFPAGAATPAFVRALQQQQQWTFYGTNGNGEDPNTCRPLPADQMEACQLTMLTNWASIQRTLCPPGARVVCQCPMNSSVANALGLDMAKIFRPDPSSPGTLMFMSNFTASKRGQELKDRIESSALFQKVFERG